MSATATDAALTAVLDAHRVRATAEVEALRAVVTWAEHHRLVGAEAVGSGFYDTGIGLGGEGCPVVSEFDVYELAAALSMSADAGCAYVGRTLELHHRLPRLWARVEDLEVPVWKALKIADSTMNLPPDGADFVDRAIAPVAHTCSFAQIDRTVEDAIARFDPVEAERRRQAAIKSRKVDIHTRSAGIDGTVQLTGILDLQDALDLEQALRAGAKALAEAGCEESLDVRRSMALGDLARGQSAFQVPDGRAVTIYAHVGDTSVATVDNTGAQTLVSQVRAWCGAATRVTVKPVIDLNVAESSPGYQPSAKVREHVVLRDRSCVFPSCARPAAGCDLDHRVAHDSGGATATDNLHPLCRRHHRTKTHAGWTYTNPAPGLYTWTSPTGLTFTVDRRPRP